jgi:hypothetical protein
MQFAHLKGIVLIWQVRHCALGYPGVDQRGACHKQEGKDSVDFIH